MTASGRLYGIYRVARNEFARVFFHSLTPAIVLLLLFLAVLYGLGGTTAYTGDSSDAGLYYNIGQIFRLTSGYGVVIAAFIGVLSIAEERRAHSLNTILSKPIYRRELIIGKFLGLNCYMLTIIAYGLLVAGLSLSLLYFTPTDPLDFVAKVAIYVLIAMVYTSVVMAIAMLISVIFNDLLISTTLAVSFLFVDGFVGWSWLSPVVADFSPYIAMGHLFIGHAADLRDPVVTAGQWFSVNAPSLFFMIAAIILVSLASMIVFTRSDNT
ncbi:MAG: ABC transporter permease subunit [Methanocella sp.]